MVAINEKHSKMLLKGVCQMVDPKLARETLGWTQAQMAQAMGADVMTISRWERGLRQMDGQSTRLVELLLDIQAKGFLKWFQKKYDV